MKYIFLFFSVSFFACTHLQKHFNASANIITAQKTIDASDRSLSFKNGYWYYNGELFTGAIKDLFNNKTIHRNTEYVNGKEDGWQIFFYEDGSLSEKRFFAKGEKDGTDLSITLQTEFMIAIIKNGIKTESC
jgi:antitoxin component YwqK of YwqJK toxin-antitoxin module